jgi:hypothetical protein
MNSAERAAAALAYHLSYEATVQAYPCACSAVVRDYAAPVPTADSTIAKALGVNGEIKFGMTDPGGIATSTFCDLYNRGLYAGVSAGGVTYKPCDMSKHGKREYTYMNERHTELKDLSLAACGNDEAKARNLRTWFRMVESATGVSIAKVDLSTVEITISLKHTLFLRQLPDGASCTVEVAAGSERKTAIAATGSVGDVLKAAATALGMDERALNAKFCVVGVEYPLRGQPRKRGRGQKRSRDDEDDTGGLISHRLDERGAVALDMIPNPLCCICTEPTHPSKAIRTRQGRRVQLVMCGKCAKARRSIRVGDLEYKQVKGNIVPLLHDRYAADPDPPAQPSLGQAVMLAFQRLAVPLSEGNASAPESQLAREILNTKAFFEILAPRIALSATDAVRFKIRLRKLIEAGYDKLADEAKVEFNSECEKLKSKKVGPPQQCR